MPVWMPFSALSLLSSSLALAGPDRAGTAVDGCETPRAAALALANGEACVEGADGVSEALVANQVRELLLARKAKPVAQAIPADADFEDDVGHHRVTPVPAVPELVLERVDGRWVVSAESARVIRALVDPGISEPLAAVVAWLPAVFRLGWYGVHLWQLVAAALLVAVGLAIGWLLPWSLETWGRRVTGRIGLELDPDTLRALRRPLRWFAVSGVVAWGLGELGLPAGGARAVQIGAALVLSVSGVLAAARAVDVISAPLLQRAKATATALDDQFVPLAARASRIAVVVLGVLFVLQSWGVDVGSLLAGLGLGGLAVALAAKDTLSNLFGSITLFADRPFQVGDWILVDGVAEGVVEDVGFRSTRIRTFADSVVSLPNGRVADARIENMGKRRRRRVRTTLSLTYDTPVDRISAYVEAVRGYLRARSDVAPAPFEVHLNELGSHSLDILVYYFLIVPDWTGELGARAECMAAFLRLAEQHQVRFAFPSSSVYVEQMPVFRVDGRAQSGAIPGDERR